MEIEILIEAIKDVFKMKRDYEIANILDIPQNTLYAWKSRNQSEKLLQELKEKYPKETAEIISKTMSGKTIISGNKVSGQLAGRDIIGHTNTRLNEIDDPQIAALAYGAYAQAKALGKIEELKKYLANAGAAITQ